MVSRSLLRRLGAAATAALLMGTFAFAAPAGASGGGKGKDLTKAVTLAGVLTHITALQVIASLNNVKKLIDMKHRRRRKLAGVA